MTSESVPGPPAVDPLAPRLRAGMKVTVDDGACHGVCVALCPEMFTLTDAGYAHAAAYSVPPELEALAAEAIAQCPERAISSH